MARLSHVLVIDNDPKGLQTVAFGFEREGCRVTTADSTDAGLASMQSARPDAVVLALRQGADASRFILEGLATPNGPPVLAMGSEEHRRAVTQNQADFLPIPAFLRDVITATRLRVATRGGSPHAGAEAGSGVVQAALSEFGLFFLLRTFLALKTSAVVQLERANRKGELKFSKGELRTAQLGTLTGAPALNQLLLWEEAAMEVRFRSVTARSQFNHKGEALVDDTERFLRDFAHTARSLGSAQTVYEAAGGEHDQPSETAPVLRLFDGQRTIADVIEESPFRVFDTLRIVSRLVDTDTIRKKQGVEPRPAVSTSAASPLMESWLRGESEVVEPADTAVTPARGGHTGPLPAPEVRSAGVISASPAAVASAATTAPMGGAAPATVAPQNAQPAAAALPPQEGVARATRGELTARNGTSDKAMRARPSMVIDLPPELLEAAGAAQSAQAAGEPPPAEAKAPTPAPVAQVAPAAAPNRPQMEPAAVSPPPGHAPRTTGSLEIRTAPRPERAPARSTGTIELDPALMAELETTKATSSPAPAPVQASAVNVAKAGGKPGDKSGPAIAKSRTGEFDQLEKDFFAREADLYKDGGTDSFDDLE